MKLIICQLDNPEMKGILSTRECFLLLFYENVEF